MRKCPALSTTSSPLSLSPLSSLHVCTLAQGSGGERAGSVQEQADLHQEWPGEWDEKRGNLLPPQTKDLVYKYPA